MTCLHCAGQLDLDKELKLVGDSLADRQVRGVSPPTVGSDGVSAGTLRTLAVNGGTSSGGTSIVLNLTPAPASYTDGLLISFVLTGSTDSAVVINANGLGDIPLLKDGQTAVDSAELELGIPHHAIYHSGVFHLLKRTSAACPDGFDIVTRDYCIELQPDTAVRWYSAAFRCALRNARLCTMGEWMKACKKLNLEPTISSWEWVDSAANSSSDAKAMGLDPVNFSDPDCEYGRTYAPTNYARYRCCYSR